MSELEGPVVTDVALLKKEARNKKTSPSRLEELARHLDSSVQLAVAGNANTSAATLEFLNRSTKPSVLKALAKNNNTPVSVLERLARHRQDTVRQAVAESAQIPETVALEMLNDVSDYTRFLLIHYSRRFPWNTLPLLERAALDPSSLVRMTVADIATVSSVLEGLLDDKEAVVVDTALCNRALALPMLMARLEITSERLNLAENWRCASQIVQRRDLPVHWLECLAVHPNATVRLFVAKNPNTPRSVLLRLARDRDAGVLSAMAALPDLPEDVYLSYVKHREVFVRLALVANPAIPRTALELLARDRNADPKTVMECWKRDMDAKIASKARERLESMT